MSASGSALKFLYKNDIRAINVAKGHPWHSIHRTHHFKRCDETLFCVVCGGTSSGNKVPWMRPPCVPNGLGTDNVRPAHKYSTIDRRLMRGRCPYPDGKWKSGHDKEIIWPPIYVQIYEDFDKCHSMCACSVCCLPPTPPDASAPSAAAPASAPLGSPPQDPDGFQSCGEEDDDDTVDWLVRAELEDICAPFRSEAESNLVDLPASSPHGASSSTSP